VRHAVILHQVHGAAFQLELGQFVGSFEVEEQALFYAFGGAGERKNGQQQKQRQKTTDSAKHVQVPQRLNYVLP